MSNLRNKSEAQAAHIKTLRIGMALYTVLLVILLFQLGQAAQITRTYIPPDIREGGIAVGDRVYPVYAYEFAMAIMKKIHLWEDNGTKDFPRALNLYTHYLTDGCRSYLQTEVEILSRAGELQNRRRSLHEDISRPFDSSLVKTISPNEWQVDLYVHVRETLNMTVVKDNAIRYPVRVVRKSIDVAKNPWGLAIDCFYEQPELLANNLAVEG